MDNAPLPTGFPINAGAMRVGGLSLDKSDWPVQVAGHTVDYRLITPTNKSEYDAFIKRHFETPPVPARTLGLELVVDGEVVGYRLAHILCGAPMRQASRALRSMAKAWLDTIN